MDSLPRAEKVSVYSPGGATQYLHLVGGGPAASPPNVRDIDHGGPMPSQYYRTTIESDDQPLAVEIHSFTNDYLSASRLFTPLQIVRFLGREHIALDAPLARFRPSNRPSQAGGESMTDALTSLIYLLVAAPEIVSDPQYLYSLPGSPWQFALPPATRENDPFVRFARYIAVSPIVSTEESWPVPKSLVDIAGAGGGVGLGVLVATGALPPLALLAVPAGVIAIGVGWSARRRLARSIDSPTDRIRGYRRLLDDGAISQDHYDAAVTNLIQDDTVPRTSP